MTDKKLLFQDSSLFRKVYIIDLFFCCISFLQIPAYILLVAVFCWGVWLVYRNQSKNNTFFHMRFGLWIGAFLIVTLLSILINFTVTVFYSAIMFLHILVCFFVFYGMHTEPGFSFKEELFFISKLIVYLTFIANVIGILCLVIGLRFEWMGIRFIIYENRFTGIYYNPNLLGFCSVISIVCCHMLGKPGLISEVEAPAVNKTFLFACVGANFFSLMLCDSNASLVLMLAYVVIYFFYGMFADKKNLSASRVILKVVSVVLVGVFITLSALVFRVICQTGFSVVFSKTNSIVDIITGNEDEIDYSSPLNDTKKKNNEKISFSHQNKNIDSGRIRLWKESIDLFKISPIVGISNGNIVFYSETVTEGSLSYFNHNNDLHNGFLTILVSTGIIGFAFFCIFGFRFAKHSAQHLFLREKPFRNDVYPCLFAFLSAYLIYSLFERALLYDISFLVMWFWLMTGYMSCYIARFEPMLERKYLFHRKRLKPLRRFKRTLL